MCIFSIFSLLGVTRCPLYAGIRSTVVFYFPPHILTNLVERPFYLIDGNCGQKGQKARAARTRTRMSLSITRKIPCVQDNCFHGESYLIGV